MTNENTAVNSSRTIVAQAEVNGFVARFEENETKTARRVVLYPASRVGEWDASRDLSLTDFSAARGGLRAVVSLAAGAVQGDGAIIFTAPLEKLTFENGTGRAAWVFSDYKNGFVANVNGAQVTLVVDPRDLPTAGAVRRLMLDGGNLYAANNDPLHTVRGLVGGWATSANMSDPKTAKRVNDTTGYWWARAVRAAICGYTVSISVGPWLMEEAEKVVAIFTATNPAEAKAAASYASRESGRMARAVTDVKESLKAAQSDGIALEANGLLVPVYGTEGETLDLAKYPAARPFAVFMQNGIRLNDWRVQNDAASRLAVFNTIIAKGYRVKGQ